MKNTSNFVGKARKWAAVGCVLAGVTIAVAAIPQDAAAAATKKSEKPNVVLMLSDNVGYGDIGAFQGGAIRGAPTPNIDSIAAEGMTFTQFLVEPGCTPSRAGLLTGRYSPRAGLGTIIIGGTPNTLQAEEITMAELFKSVGYATGYVGKWHLGSRNKAGQYDRALTSIGWGSSKPAIRPCTGRKWNASVSLRKPSKKRHPESGMARQKMD